MVGVRLPPEPPCLKSAVRLLPDPSFLVGAGALRPPADPYFLAVEGVPDFADQRRKLLPLGRRFATMPEEIKALYEHPTSFYSFGWSHGKEKLQGD